MLKWSGKYNSGLAAKFIAESNSERIFLKMVNICQSYA